MLQNKFSFNQSSVSLEIIGLPDYSNDESKENISIISQWKLMIIDKPVIEGNVDHLKTIMNAFNYYSKALLNDEILFYESDLIDIKAENSYSHTLLLKSSKPEVQPLKIKIGNSVLADIVNCFDQLNSSNRVNIIYSKDLKSLKNKKYLYLFDSKDISNFLLPPIFSLFSILIVSTSFIYFYDGNNIKDNRSFLNTKNELNSINSINKLL